MNKFIDEEMKRDAARIATAAIRRRLQEVAETPMGDLLRATVAEHRRILIEQNREPTVRDAARFLLKIFAYEEEDP